ncbi:MAG: AMP-binding protein [Cellulosilyticaceae bacterium]
MLVEKTIGQVLEETSKRYQEKLAIVSQLGPREITWGELNNQSTNIGFNLKKLGLKKGDRIAIVSANIPEWIMIFFGCSKQGIITVPINANLKQEEIEYIVESSNCKAIFFQEKFRKNNIIDTMKNLKNKPLTQIKHFIFLGNTKNEFMNFEQLKLDNLENSILHNQETLHPAETIIILFTSGTTSQPKGVKLSHLSLVNNALALRNTLEITQDETMCLAAPLFHCFGVTATLLVATLAGSRMALLKECSTKGLLETLEHFNCTILNGVPTMFNNLIQYKEIKNYDLSALNKGIIAGAKYSVDFFEKVSEGLSMQYIIPSYGQTECAPACTMAALSDTLDIRSKSVGKILEDIAIKIIDPNTKESVDDHQIGELCVKGYSVMQGYCNTMQNPIDEEQWLHTGDLGYKDEAGYYYITGRLKDIIIRGGENISPFEIEEVIKQLPGIKECQVVGIEDDKYGEEVVACIVLEEGMKIDANEIKEYIASQLATYKVPKYIVILEKIAMTASGKFNKQLLKQQILEMLKATC